MSELEEDMTIETILNETEIKVPKKIWLISKLWENIKQPDIHVTKVPNGQEKGHSREEERKKHLKR